MPTAPTGANCRHVMEVPNQIELVGMDGARTLAVVSGTAS
jgi:hypothetical protein